MRGAADRYRLRMSTLIKDLTALLGTAAATTRWDGRVEEELAPPMVAAGLA